jgi:uncharacterized protein (TIGR02599 family)
MNNRGFSLLEVIVTVGLVVVIVGILVTMTDQTQRVMKSSSGKAEQFHDARIAFDTITRRLSQATLNSQPGFNYREETQMHGSRQVTVKIPQRSERFSDLRFFSGPMSRLVEVKDAPQFPTHGIFFQAPLGYFTNVEKDDSVKDALNTWGYFIEYGEDVLPAAIVARVNNKRRYRLMEFLQPTEQLRVYEQPLGLDWIQSSLGTKVRTARPIADDIVALLILPRLARSTEIKREVEKKATVLAPDFVYDSTQSTADTELSPLHRLPPIVQVSMIALDDLSAARMENSPVGPVNYADFFEKPDLLDDDPKTAAPLDGDITHFVETELTKRLRLVSRVFTTTISLREAQ